MLPDIHVVVRAPITSRDMRDIVAIEQAAYQFPRSKANIFKDRNFVLLADYHSTVAAYMIFRLYRYQLFLDNIVVRHEFLRKGVGTHLLQRLIGLIKSVRNGYTENNYDSVAISDIRNHMANQRCRSIDLYVRESNLHVLYFFRSVGFEAIKVVRNFYNKPRDTNEDAYIMHWPQCTRPILPHDPANRIKRYFF